MLQKMGWREGKGLGALEDGGLEHVKVKMKCDTTGLGVKKGRDDEWIAAQQEFDDILATLNSPSVTTGNPPTADEDLSCHQIKGMVPNSLKRLSYKKTVGSKDLSKKSDEEINCVLGKRRKFIKHKKYSVKDRTKRTFLRMNDACERISNAEEATTSPS